MATFVSYARAAKLPAVLKKYKKVGQFRKAVLAAVAAGTWAKKPLQTGVVRKANSIRVDVSAIPGVRALKRSGRPA